MTLPNEIVRLRAPLAAVRGLLERFDNAGLIIGGVAVSLLGKPRLTVDVDAVVLVPGDDVPHLIETAHQEGLIIRIPDAEEFANRNRILLLRHEETGVNVDISLGILPFEVEAVERGVLHPAGELMLRLPTPEDLIIFKAVAHRPRDLDDIRAILDAHPNLDRERIRYWVPQFAEVLERPELWDDIAPWL